MVATTFTIQTNKAGVVKIMKGKMYIMGFTDGCMDMAEAMCAELNRPGGGAMMNTLKAKYRDLKRERGVHKGKRSRLPAGMEDIPDRISVEDTPEDKERRIGYVTGLTAQEIDQRLVLLPTLIDQARDAKAKAQLAQGEVAKLWYENHRAWQAVAEAVLGIDNELRKALEQELARSPVPEGREI